MIKRLVGVMSVVVAMLLAPISAALGMSPIGVEYPKSGVVIHSNIFTLPYAIDHTVFDYRVLPGSRIGIQVTVEDLEIRPWMYHGRNMQVVLKNDRRLRFVEVVHDQETEMCSLNDTWKKKETYASGMFKVSFFTVQQYTNVYCEFTARSGTYVFTPSVVVDGEILLGDVMTIQVPGVPEEIGKDWKPKDVTLPWDKGK